MAFAESPKSCRFTRYKGEGEKPDHRIKIEGIICKVINDSFPELLKLKIKLKETSNDQFYMFSRFNANRVILGKKKGYVVIYNPKVFSKDKPTPPLALESIIAHELSHTFDYTKKSRFGLLFMIRHFLGKKALARYERRIDLETILRGYTQAKDAADRFRYFDGLAQYRHWVYGMIPPETLEKKKLSYFRPEEFDILKKVVMVYGTDAIDYLRKNWKGKEVPLTLQESHKAVTKMIMALGDKKLQRVMP